MDMQDMIGGAFGLELPCYDNFPYKEGPGCVYASSGRAAFECLLRSMPRRPRRILAPLFACNTLLEPLARFGVPVVRYGVTGQLEPLPPGDAAADDLLLLIDYFGLAGDAVRRAAAAHPGPVIVDASTALYSRPLPGVPTFYSPRKFGGLADGGVACAPFAIWRPEGQDASARRSMALFVRLESGAAAAADSCQAAEDSLLAPPLRMSPLTRRLLQGVDWEAAAQARSRHYAVLHAVLAPLNRLQLPAVPPSAPFCYPFVSGIPGLRDSLIDAGVALPLFWPEVIDATDALSVENRLARTLLPLPLDQRHSVGDMERLLSLIL